MNKYLNCVTASSLVSLKESTKTSPVTMKMDPKGFYVYWINQSKVISFKSLQ